jgi:hypothetical protein
MAESSGSSARTFAADVVASFRRPRGSPLHEREISPGLLRAFEDEFDQERAKPKDGSIVDEECGRLRDGLEGLSPRRAGEIVTWLPFGQSRGC